MLKFYSLIFRLPSIQLILLLLAWRLQNDFTLDGGLILWLLNFLSQRVHQVKVGSLLSDKISTNIGSPQGCVLSPLLYMLYILYTNSCSSSLMTLHWSASSRVMSRNMAQFWMNF